MQDAATRFLCSLGQMFLGANFQCVERGWALRYSFVMLKLDQIDLKILRVLSDQGRITKSALAERVGLSPSPCWERLRRLESSGLISGYRADINLRKLPGVVTVFVTIELDSHAAARFQSFERTIGRHPEITGCWAIGGGYDYLIQVVSPTIEAYQDLIESVLEASGDIARYYSYIVTKTIRRPGPPLHLLMSQPDESSV
jgi:Lrp/AsnC family transcriptional regulator of ectoine degradation